MSDFNKTAHKQYTKKSYYLSDIGKEVSNVKRSRLKSLVHTGHHFLEVLFLIGFKEFTMFLIFLDEIVYCSSLNGKENLRIPLVLLGDELTFSLSTQGRLTGHERPGGNRPLLVTVIGEIKK